MTIREKRAVGTEALNLATTLLQRCRLDHPFAGVFEAADVQWSWRKTRMSDEVEKIFWLDDHGPVGGILLTSSSQSQWQIDPVFAIDSTGSSAETIWNHLTQHIEDHPDIVFTIPVSDTDIEFSRLARQAGLRVMDKDSTGWLDAEERPAIIDLPDGFHVVSRLERPGTKHPMIGRNGEQIEARLQQCSLYDPALDLAIETETGEIAGYSLYWFDPVTKVGLIEPVRVHEEYQRKGLARAMLAHGIDLLVRSGAERIKVSWETEAAGALYLGSGFRQTSTTTWYSTALS